MTDEVLMDHVKNDQLNYLGEIFNRYHLRIYGYFHRMTNNQMLSEDLTQNVFERIIKFRSSYKEKASFQTWIFRIAKNCLMDHFRSKKKLFEQSLDQSHLEIAHVEDDDVEQIHQVNKVNMQRAMSQLKEEHREIILLTRFENLSYKEAATVIGLTENAVKARVFRAIKSLRKVYNQNSSIA